jgi:hypothetical protein
MKSQTASPFTPDRRQSPRSTDRRHPRQKVRPKDYGWTVFMLLVTLVMVVGFIVSHGHPFKPGDIVGYNLGLVGGLMMLTLMLYPMRKRIGFMKNWAPLPKWFKWHMVFGILGPMLIVLHSTFFIGSINAGVALICMMLVSGSGIFGRFFYTKIHFGLYGRQASLKQLQEDLEGSGDVKSIFSFAPVIQQKLTAFQEYALNTSKKRKIRPWTFIMLSIRAKLLSRDLIKALEEAMYADANEKQWNDAQMNRLDEMFYQNVEFIRNYIHSIRDLAQFSTYEKLFSLWHIFHVPLVYMLVFSAIWHVVAVHMY